jgi:Carbohydrate family 9 binding domain-like
MRRRQAEWGPRGVAFGVGKAALCTASKGRFRRLMVPLLALPWSVALGVGSTALCASGCLSDEKTAEAPPEDIQKYIVDAVPEKALPLNVNFDGKLTLLAVELDPGLEAAPGKRVKMNLYWRVDKALDDPEWKLFTHVLDGAGDRLMNIDNVGPLRHLRRNGQTFPPGSWAAGKIYVDSQSFTVPRKVKTSKIQVVTGIWKGANRLPVLSGEALKDNRAVVATITLGSKAQAKTAPVPELDVPALQRGQSIRIDGKLDDSAWQSAAATSAFVSVSTGQRDPESKVQGSAKLLWDDKWLYVGFEVKDQDVVGGFDKKQEDPHLWTKDCVEIMLDPDGDGDNKDYYEIQVNPQNLVFDSQFDDYNRPREEPNGPFGHQEWSSKLESAVRVHGTLDATGQGTVKDKDEGYTVELRIPWASFGKAKAAPPRAADSWRLNLYAMQDNNGVSWSPILEQGNFHKASRFGKVTWIAEEPKPAAVAEGVVPAPAAPTPAPARASVSTDTTTTGDLSVTKKALQQAPEAPASVPPATRPPTPPPAPAPAPAPAPHAPSGAAPPAPTPSPAPPPPRP